MDPTKNNKKKKKGKVGVFLLVLYCFCYYYIRMFDYKETDMGQNIEEP